MIQRKALALLLACGALGIFLMSLVFAIAETLPGTREQREWMFRQMEWGDLGPIFSNPIVVVLMIFTCITPLAFVLGGFALMLWRSARRQERKDDEQQAKRSRWSTTALLHEIDALLRAASESEAALASRAGESLEKVYPHLSDPHRRSFERALAQLGLLGHAVLAAGSGEPPPRWPRDAASLLLILAAFQVGMAALVGVNLTVFDEVPVAGLPVGPSAVFQGIAIWLVAAILCTLLAFGLKRLDRSAAQKAEAAAQAGREVIEQLSEGLRESLQRLGPAGEPRFDRTASALAMALLETAERRDRRRLLQMLELSGYVPTPHVLDLGEIEPGLHEQSGVERSPAERPQGWGLRLEIWALLCLHGAVLVMAGVSHAAALYVGQLLGWLPGPKNAVEVVAFSELGYMLNVALFLLVAITLLALVWRLSRLAREWSG